MRIDGSFYGGFEEKWRPSLDDVARMFGLRALALRRSDLARPARRDERRLRLAIWVRGRQVGELVAVGRTPLTLSESPIEVQALFAMREAIENDLGRVAAVA